MKRPFAILAVFFLSIAVAIPAHAQYYGGHIVIGGRSGHSNGNGRHIHSGFGFRIVIPVAPNYYVAPTYYYPPVSVYYPPAPVYYTSSPTPTTVYIERPYVLPSVPVAPCSQYETPQGRDECRLREGIR